jgi:hypothetical protein
MISADLITRYFNLNHRVIHLQIDGLTHADSLLQPPFRANCLNWVLGHVVAARNNALILLGAEPVWSEQEATPYATDSEPITGDGAGHRLEKLVADLDRSQEWLEAALERVSAAELARVEGEHSLGERLAGLYWHEAYHTGQTEYLRQLAGKNDKVV